MTDARRNALPSGPGRVHFPPQPLTTLLQTPIVSHQHLLLPITLATTEIKSIIITTSMDDLSTLARETISPGLRVLTRLPTNGLQLTYVEQLERDLNEHLNRNQRLAASNQRLNRKVQIAETQVRRLQKDLEKRDSQLEHSNLPSYPSRPARNPSLTSRC